MSQNRQQSNKDRSANFSKEESSKLMFLLKDYPIITSKKTDHASNHQKEAAWRLLTDKFNSDATKFRSSKQLQQKYNNMKKTARKEMAAEKYGRRQTGGGPPPPKPSETTEWLNTIMGESISGLPTVYDSDAVIDNTDNVVPIDIVDLETTANINLNVSQEKYVEDYMTDVDSVLIESEQPMKENFPNNIELPSSSGFDASTPKAMLRQPVSKELSFIQKKKKTAFTPSETRKRLVMHSEKKIEFLNKKEGREINLAQYAKEEHELNIKHKEELHELEVTFKKKMHELVLEKCKYEVQKAKLELNSVFQS